MDEIKTSLEDHECREAFLEAFKRLCENDKRLGQLRSVGRIEPTGDQSAEIAA